MNALDHIEYVPQYRNTIKTAGVKLFAIWTFIAFLSVSAAFGQSTYSDSWLVGSTYTGDSIDYGEDNSATPSIVGCGVTDGSYMHSYYLQATMSKPNGNSVYSETFPQMGHTRTDLQLSWGQSDVGDYLTETQHFGSCNICEACEINYYSIGSTIARLPVGISFTCFEFVRVTQIFVGRDGVTKRTALYRITEPCNASCRANTATYTFPHPIPPSPALLSAEPYVGRPPYNVCSRIAVLQSFGSCNGCSDVNLP